MVSPDDSAKPAVRVGVLGPLTLAVDGAPVEVPGMLRRSVLATLALEDGRPVGDDALLDALWPDGSVHDPAQALRSHVSRLRHALGPAADRLTRVGQGYALRLDVGELDAAQAAAAARRLAPLLAKAPAEAAELARDTLGLWRGRALSEFAGIHNLEAAAAGLEELRLTLRDGLLEARLSLGDRGVAGEALAAVGETPMREDTTVLAMRALAAAGRGAEAMELAASYRRRLDEETGLDPSPALSRWEQQVASGAVPRPRSASYAVARPRAPLVGREGDRERVVRLFEDHGMVTVTGPGGVGKSRLVQEIAADLSDQGVPVAVVPLATVTGEDQVPAAVATALDLRPGATVEGDVARALSGSEVVLVLDNCEHVLDACRRLIAALCRHAPGVRVIATSRVTLATPDEYVVRLAPLPVPGAAEPLDRLRGQPAVRALLEHAERRHAGFELTARNAPDVADLVRRLDGLPLALELAAGRIPYLSVSDILERWDRAPMLLSADGEIRDARHRTLDAVVGWSYRLLGEPEQRLLRFLAVFPAGVDARTAEALTGPDSGSPDPLAVLGRLVDASLIVIGDQGGMIRYGILETVRSFLLQELVRRDERAAAEQAFVHRCVAVATELGGALASSDEELADLRLRAELPNLRAALRLALVTGAYDDAVSIALALDESAVLRDTSEIWLWVEELADDRRVLGHDREVEILGAAATGAWVLGDRARAAELARRGLDTAAANGLGPPRTARCTAALGAVALYEGDFEGAGAAWRRAAQDHPNPCTKLGTAALAAAFRGDDESAAALLRDAWTAHGASGTWSGAAFLHYVSGELTRDDAAAVAMYQTAIARARGCGAGFVVGVAMVGLTSRWTAIGARDQAARGLLDVLQYWDASGNRTQLWTTVRNAAVFLLGQGRLEQAALLLMAADLSDVAAAVAGARSAEAVAAVERVMRDLPELTRIELHARAASMTQREVSRVAQAALVTVARDAEP